MPAKLDTLARKICGEIARQQAGRTMLWVSIDGLNLAESPGAVEAALRYAEGKNWVRTGGDPPHSAIITYEGLSVVAPRR